MKWITLCQLQNIKLVDLKCNWLDLKGILRLFSLAYIPRLVHLLGSVSLLERGKKGN